MPVKGGQLLTHGRLKRHSAISRHSFCIGDRDEESKTD